MYVVQSYECYSICIKSESIFFVIASLFRVIGALRKFHPQRQLFLSLIVEAYEKIIQ